ncbi:MAG: Flp pilus assembly protein TadD, partial [Planctomycetota bacterium]
LGTATSGSLNLLGDIYVNQELYGLAVDSYLAAMAKDKKRKPERVIRAAKVLAARSALDDAGRLIDKIEKVFGKTLAKNDQKDLLKIRARIAVAKGNGGDEVSVLHKIVELDPLDGEALILLGKYYGRGENKEKAIFYYERAANLEKFEADAKVYHAQILVGQRKYDQALPLLRRAQSIKERDNIRKYIEQVERISKKR